MTNSRSNFISGWNWIAVLLLAYFNGNASLCRAIVKVGARLGIVNRDGLSIFNAPVATKQLLFKLLGTLTIKRFFTLVNC